MKTLKGPALFLAQFIGDKAPFDRLDTLAGWAAGLGYSGVQVPTTAPHLFDLAEAARQTWLIFLDESGLGAATSAALREAGHEVRSVRAGKRVTLADAVDLVLYAFEQGQNGDIFVQKAPGATIETLTQAILQLMGKPGHEVREIGTRHGEKLYEALLSREEMACGQDLGDYYRVPPDGRDLNYAKFVDQGEQKLTQALHHEEYHSHNTTRLDVEGMKALLLKLDFMRKIAAGEHAAAED